jgi:hypothetical protein
MSKVYVGDTGTVIVLDCGQNVSAASARAIAARKPDGTVASWSAVAEGANSIKYTTEVTTLDQAGTWQLQAVVTLAAGTWRGESVALQVYPAFG